MMKLYVSGPLTGIRRAAELRSFYERVASVSEQYGYSTFVPHKHSDPITHAHLRPSEVYQRDWAKVSESDLVVAYVGLPSIGVGLEIEIAHQHKVAVVLLYERGATVSRMVLGSPAVKGTVTAKNLNGIVDAWGRYVARHAMHPVMQNHGQERCTPVSDAAPGLPRHVPTQPAPNIPDALIKDLIGVLSGMRHLQTFAGRTNLLTGLPGITTFTRIQTNAQDDLEGIVAQLQARGRRSSGEWPLLKLIDNALPYGKGYELGDQLSKVRQSLAQIYQEM